MIYYNIVYYIFTVLFIILQFKSIMNIYVAINLHINTY